MVITIYLTAHQAASLRHVIEKSVGMAERSPTVAALLNIEAEDLVRCKSILDALPKPSKNGRTTAPLSGDVQPPYPAHRGNHTTATVAAPSAASGDH